MDEGGVGHLNKPLRLGVVRGGWGWQRELPGKKWGETRPPLEMGVKTFELAQLNLFIPERKKGGGPHCRFIAKCWQGLSLGGMEYGARTWT